MHTVTLGILGGTFDPIHRAHLRMAEIALQRLKLDRVLFIPSGDPPHKIAKATAVERLEMVRIALCENPRMEACAIETSRTGTTYTVDTLRQLREQYPAARFTYIIGGDTLFDLVHWRAFGEVARLTEFAVFQRAGSADLTSTLNTLHDTYGAIFHLLNEEIPAISSSEIRRGYPGSLTGNVPPAIIPFIRRHGLYRSPAARPLILDWLQGHLTDERMSHTLAVEATAREIAVKFSVDPDSAALAGLIHDCAKHPGCDMIKTATDYGLAIDEVERAVPGLLHGRVGAELAREVFAIRDERVLTAVRWHVTGCAGMDALGYCLCVADFTEPSRTFPEAEHARQTLNLDPLEAFCEVQSLKLSFALQNKLIIHPRTVDALNDIRLNHGAKKEETS